jgi:hypothetical protein
VRDALPRCDFCGKPDCGHPLLESEGHSESQIELPPFAIGVKAGGVLRVEGLALRVVRVNNDGSIDYAVR